MSIPEFHALALRALLALGCAIPILLMAWQLRGWPWCAIRWIAAMLVLGLGFCADPLAVALLHVDGIMFGKFCVN
jgi:hypothetical protein